MVLQIKIKNIVLDLMGIKIHARYMYRDIMHFGFISSKFNEISSLSGQTIYQINVLINLFSFLSFFFLNKTPSFRIGEYEQTM